MDTESVQNKPEVNVLKIDAADLSSISFEPQSPDSDARDQKSEVGGQIEKEDEQKPEEKPTEEAGASAKTGEEKETKAGEKTGDATPKKPSRFEKRINQLTYEKTQALHMVKSLEQRLAALERGEKPPAQKATDAGDAKPKPKVEDFQAYEEYIVALGEWSAERKLSEKEKAGKEKEARALETEAESNFQAKIETAKAEIEDFEKVVFDPSLKISQTVVGALMDSDLAADVLYFLGKNPDEAARISVLSPAAVAREIGKIEAKIGNNGSPAGSDTPPKKK